MGNLVYGKINAQIDDRSLFHLDVLLARLGGSSFQLHLMGAGRHDGDLLSLSISPGVPLTLQYENSPGLRLEPLVIDRAVNLVAEGGFVSLPFAFEGGSLDPQA